MNKLKKYVGNIFSTFGLLSPLIIISLVYVIFISIDRNNGIANLYNNYKGWFYSLLVILCLGIIICLYALIKNLNKSNVNISDLILFIVFALSILLTIVFAFNLGKDANVVIIIKWIAVGVFIACTFVLGMLRAKNIK